MAAVAVKNQSVRKKRKSPRRKEPLHGFAAKARESGVIEQFDRLADSILLTEHETSQVVGHPPNTLKHWRLHGIDKGPKPVRMPSSSVRYRVGSIRAWLANLSE